MKLIKPSFNIIEQSAGLEGIYKQIETAGRTCYKSEDKITKDSASKFVERMVKSGHGAMLEHGTVYLKVTCKDTDCITLSMFYGHNKYSKVTHSEDNKTYYITTNYRVLVENNHLGDLKYLCEPTEFHERRITVRFVCDRGVSHEFVRHRVFSFAQESTRYCNYYKDKFGNELTFIIPYWCDDIPDNLQLKDKMEVSRFVWGTDNLYNAVIIENGTVRRKVSKFTQRFLYEMIGMEDTYIGLIAAEYKPQEARTVLPNSLKTELVMTGFISDWQHFFGLRCDKAAHPQARELALPLQEEFIKRGYINN